MFDILIDPVPKPRMTHADRWKKRSCVLRYFEYARRLKMEADRQGFELGNSFYVEFQIAMPQSWSKKKRLEMCGKPHRSRCDLDNALKAFCDALLEQDCTIADVAARKRWAEQGRIIAFNAPLLWYRHAPVAQASP